MPPHARYSFS